MICSSLATVRATLIERHGWLRTAGLLALLAATICAVGWHRLSPHSLTSKANRYVSLSPAITETLVALGVDSQLVGVSDYCHYPPPIQAIHHVGSGYTPRYEAIVALAPTLVFVESVNAVSTRSEERRVGK